MLARPEFTRCYELGRKLHTARFIVFGLPRERFPEGAEKARPDHELPRLGLAVSGKVGSAVVRNRIKRVLREWFRLERAALAETIGATDLVLVAKRGMDHAGLGLAGARDELAPVMRRLAGDLKRLRTA